jgi:transposase InsO family protein
VDVKKLGRIPDGGGWRAHGRAATTADKHHRPKVGFDYVHSLVDDHSRLAYSDPLGDPARRDGHHLRGLPDPRSDLLRSPWHHQHRTRHDRQRLGLQALAQDRVRRPGRQAGLHQAALPLANGKVERLNRTLLTEWAYRQAYATNTERAAALAPWLEHYNTQRRHSALGGLPPISRLLPT